MDCWNVGVMGPENPVLHYSITPLLLLLAAPQVLEETAFLHVVDVSAID